MNSLSALAISQKGWTVEGDYKIPSDLQYAEMGRWRRLMGMKQILVMMVVVVLVGCSKDTPEPVSPAEEKVIADPIVEEAIRKSLNGHEGELIEADLEKVAFLLLHRTQITDTGLKEVAKLQQLKGLGLNDTKITDAGLVELAELQKLTGLDLRRTKITDAGLVELAKLQQLEGLGLTGTKISDEGLKEVAKLQQLTTLGLDNTQITDAGLKELAEVHKLKYLVLIKTKVTKEGVAELKKALPNCRISGP